MTSYQIEQSSGLATLVGFEEIPSNTHLKAGVLSGLKKATEGGVGLVSLTLNYEQRLCIPVLKDLGFIGYGWCSRRRKEYSKRVQVFIVNTKDQDIVADLKIKGTRINAELKVEINTITRQILAREGDVILRPKLVKALQKTGILHDVVEAIIGENSRLAKAQAVHSDLMHLFHWRSSRQGHGYWEGVNRELSSRV